MTFVLHRFYDFSLFSDFPAFYDCSNFFLTPESCSPKNFTSKTYFWVFFWLNLELEQLHKQILVITFFSSFKFSVKLEIALKNFQYHLGGWKFFWRHILGWQICKKYFQQIWEGSGGQFCSLDVELLIGFFNPVLLPTPLNRLGEEIPLLYL